MPRTTTRKKTTKRHKRHTFTVRQPTIKELLALPKLFKKAVYEDYTFYEEKVQKNIISRYSLKHLLRAYLSERRILLVASDDIDIFGVLVGIISPDGLGMINWIYVHPKFRKGGVASELLTNTEQIFKEKNSHKIMIATEIAPEFYKKMGYDQEGLLKKHWWGKDFYIFTKYLKDKKTNKKL